MKGGEARHYTEEELLMHLLQEETPESGRAVAEHISKCSVCAAVFQDLETVKAGIERWALPEVVEEVWQARKNELLDLLRQGQAWRRQRGFFGFIRHYFPVMWEYALNNPLPTLGYITAAVAFASERTITVFRLEQILPATSEMLEFLMQVL